MGNKLKPGKLCPLHRSKVCCGRGPIVRPVKELKYRVMRDGTKVYPGGREVCTKAGTRRRKDTLISQDPTCGFCQEKFNEYDEIELCHRRSKKIGGSEHDDRWENIFLGHKTANRKQGSMPLEIYLESCKSK